MPTNIQILIVGSAAVVLLLALAAWSLSIAVRRHRSRANRITLGTLHGVGSLSMQKSHPWIAEVVRWAEAIHPIASAPFACNAAPPASPEEIAALEAEIGRVIPAPICRFLLEVASEVNFYWHLEDDAIPDVPGKPDSGSCEFGVEVIRVLNRSRLADIYKDEEDRAIAERWSNAFEFMGAPNGDQIALDLHENPESPPVIYLNHEEPHLHIRLADSFDEFIKNWFAIGCVGPESCILRHFMTDNGKPLPPGIDGTPTSKIDPNCPNAKAFRAFFGL